MKLSAPVLRILIWVMSLPGCGPKFVPTMWIVEGILLVFVCPSHLILCLRLWWLGYLSHQLIYGFIQILKIHVISNVLRSENVLTCIQTSTPTGFVAIKII
jgi:hypothetical protein